MGYFCLLITTAVLSELIYFKNMQWEWYVRKRRKHSFGCAPALQERKDKILSFLWGLNYAGIFGPFTLPTPCVSLPGLGEQKHDEKFYSNVSWPEDKEDRTLWGQAAPQGLTTKKYFSCKSFALPVSAAMATGHAAEAQPLWAARTRMDRQPLSFLIPQDYWPFVLLYILKMESEPWCRHQKHKFPQAKQTLYTTASFHFFYYFKIYHLI